MKKIFKILGIIIIVLILVLILFYNLPKILGVFTSDIVSIDETGLELSIKPILDSDNGFYDLEKISPLLYKPTQATGTDNIISELYSGKNWDEKLAEEIVTKNKQALLEFSNTAQKNAFQNPIYNNISNIIPDMPLPKLNDWRTISQISSIKSQILLNQGKNNEAMTEAIKSVKVGQLITDANGTLMEYLVGIAIKNIGLDSVENIITKSNFKKDEMVGYSDELSKLYDTKNGLRSTFIILHIMREAGIDSMMSNFNKLTPDSLKKYTSNVAEEYPEIMSINPKNFYYYRPNETKQLDADYTREQIKNLSVTCDSLKDIIELEKLTPTNFIKFYLTENVIGKVTQDAIRSSFNSLYQKRCDVNNRLNKIIDSLK